MFRLKIPGHHTLLSREEPRVHPPQVLHRALGDLLRYEIGEDPADLLQTQSCANLVYDSGSRVLQKPDVVLGALLAGGGGGGRVRGEGRTRSGSENDMKDRVAHLLLTSCQGYAGVT